jgi:hypothetical protein
MMSGFECPEIRRMSRNVTRIAAWVDVDAAPSYSCSYCAKLANPPGGPSPLDGGLDSHAHLLCLHNRRGRGGLLRRKSE